MNRLKESFFQNDVLKVAPELIGKILARKFNNGDTIRYKITEVEAYKGEDDLGCHASKGRTKRNEIMYHQGGHVYVYLIYGIYWMLNFVTGDVNIPQAVLIRSLEKLEGPGRLTKYLKIDKSFYGENLSTSDRIWVEDNQIKTSFTTNKRIGIEYAGEVWANKPWRFIAK